MVNRSTRCCLSLYVALGMVISTTPAASAQRSLNLGFEIESLRRGRPAAWTVPEDAGTAVVLDSAVRHTGRRSLRLQHPGGQLGEVQASAALDLLPQFLGRRLRFSAWVRSDSVGGSLPVLYVVQYAEDGHVIHRDSATARRQSAGRWTRIAAATVVDPHADDWDLIASAPRTGTGWVDDVAIDIGGQSIATDPLTEAPITRAEVEWAHRNANPLAGVDLALGTTDLDAVAPALADARIIGLGEAMHGSSEFRQFDARFVAWAVERLGVRLVALEENELKVQRLNDYVRNGRGDPAELVRNAYDMWRNSETLELLEWIRRYNASGRGHVELAGIDIVDGKPPADSVMAVLRRIDPEYAARVAPLYGLDPV